MRPGGGRGRGIRVGLERALKEFRFAPASFALSRSNAIPAGPEEVSEAEAFAAFFTGIARPRTGAMHLVLLSYLPLHYTHKLELVFARLLQQRGWKVSIITRGATDSIARAYHGSAGDVDILRLEDFLTFSREKQIADFVKESVGVARRSIAEFKHLTYRGAPIAQNVIASLTAAQPDGVIGDDPRTFRRMARLLRQSALLVDAAEAMYTALDPSLVICQEKGFVGTCETFYAALNLGIDFVQWVSCHQPESVMFKRFHRNNSRDHPFSVSEVAWRQLKNTPWDEHFRGTVLEEFDRGYRSGDWFKYKKLASDQSFPERTQLLERLGLDTARKTAVIYSHILNDANLFYGTDLFPAGYEQWLVETVRAAADNAAVNWIVKLHPANIFRNSRLGYTGEYGEIIALKNAFGEIPPFLTLVRPDEKVSPLSFFGITDWGITVRGTVGLELPCFGVPVLTAGTGRYAAKGFTVDSATIPEYLERIRGIHEVAPLSEAQRRLAILHACVVFRARPARYGNVFRDTYPDTKQRNLELLLRDGAQTLADPQLQSMAGFLVSGDDDFLDSEAMQPTGQ